MAFMKSPLACSEIVDGEDRVKFEVVGTVNNPSYPNWQDQMLDVNVTVKGCTLGGKFSTEFMPVDVYTFRQQLISINYGVDEIAVFEGLMGYLQLRLPAAENGLFEVHVKTCDVPRNGAT